MFDFFQQHRLLLAPMAGVSDEAFRALCREQGADLAYTEMVSAKGLSLREREDAASACALAPGEDQVAVQLFGHEPDTMAARGRAGSKHEMGEALAYLDVNMGCPARKIVSKGDGSALMKEPELAASIVRAVAQRGGAPGHGEVPARLGTRATRRRRRSRGAWRTQARAAVAVHGRFAEQLLPAGGPTGAPSRA